MTLLLIALVALLAFSNGANDNGKGVATLVGFGAAKPAQALLYATGATAVGGAVSFFIAGGLLKGFSGGWLFDKTITLDHAFYAAVLIGACGWMLVANKTGMPVSTTHAIIGALCGAGLTAFGGAKFQWSALGMKFALPLALSPVLSLATVYVVAWPVLWIVGKFAGRCVCVVEESLSVQTAGAASSTARSNLTVVTGQTVECAPERPVVMANTSTATTGIHWLSGGLISFARGWNDTPKIAALGVLALSTTAHGTAIGFLIVTLAMATGGLVMGRTVLETLSTKLTPLPLAESLTASVITAALVGMASWIALPVSTTHVTTGAIIGAGLKNNPRCVKWGKVGEIVLSWLITLPVAALIAAAAKWVVR